MAKSNQSETKEPPPQRRLRAFLGHSSIDKPAVRSLYHRLRSEGIDVWIDEEDLFPGQDWQHEIRKEVQEADVVIVCVSEDSVSKTGFIQQEIKFALDVADQRPEDSIYIIPLKLEECVVPERLKRWHWVNFYDEKGYERLLRALKATANRLGINLSPALIAASLDADISRTPNFDSVPNKPVDFVDRPLVFKNLKQHLLDDQQTALTSITSTTLLGTGGFGKTTLAIALCHDADVRKRFRDGIFWVTLGEKKSINLIGKIEDLLQSLLGKRDSFTSEAAAAAALGGALSRGRYLLVVDDVWRYSDLEPFLHGAPRCKRLITTRKSNVLPSNEKENAIPVDAMQTGEALLLLSKGLRIGNTEKRIKRHLERLSAQLGEWPLLLKLANRALRNQVNSPQGRTLADALNHLQSELDKRGVTAFDVADPDERDRRDKAVAATLEVSLQQLKKNERDRFEELAIFPEDVDVTCKTIQRLWGKTGEMVKSDTEALLSRLEELSLLFSYNLRDNSLRLHDVVRQYLQRTINGRLSDLHQQFLDSYALSRWALLSEQEPYLWEHLAEHLLAAGHKEDLIAAARDIRYLAKKVVIKGSSYVEQDLGLIADDSSLQKLKQQIGRMSHLLFRAKTPQEAEGVIVSGLCGIEEAEQICRTWEQEMVDPVLVARLPLRELQNSALQRTLTAHTDDVTGCAIGPDGNWLISASKDKTLKIWEGEMSKPSYTFTGHTDEVNRCAISPDGTWFVSASKDKTLKIWDLATDDVRVTLSGHTGGVTGCAISPDGTWLVSSSADKTLRVWDVRSGETRLIFTGHTGGVTGCAISPDGKWLASSSADRTLKIWDVQSGEVRHTLTGHELSVTGCAISPDGTRVVSSSGDNTLRIWDAVTGKVCHTFKGFVGGVTGCAISPDGTWLVSSFGDNTLKVWDIATYEMRRILRGHIGRVTGCAISPDNTLLVSNSEDRTLKIWDINADEARHTLTGHTKWVCGCAISPDGKWLVSAGHDKTLRIWDTDTGKARHILTGHTHNYVNACAISPDGAWLVSASDDRTLRIWDASTGEVRHILRGHTRSVMGCAISPDGKWLASASGDRTLKLWDVGTGQELRTLRGHDSRVFGCAISPDGKWLASASEDKTLKLWDATTGEELRTLRGHDGRVKGCAISPDGGRLVSASEDKTLKLWDATTGEELRTLRGHTDWVMGCAISPDGRWIASTSKDDTLKLWDITNCEVRQTFADHMKLVNHCAFSADSTWLVSASSDCTLKIWDIARSHYVAEGHKGFLVRGCTINRDGTRLITASDDTTLKLWDVATGEVRGTFNGHTGWVNACAISPDSAWFVSASNDRTLKIWDMTTGEVRHTLTGHTRNVTGCAISPDGTWLVSTSEDATLKIWDSATGKLRESFTGHARTVKGCAISPDGAWLASASVDNTLKIWDVTTGKVLQTLEGHNGELYGCAISPDGSWLVAASRDRVLKIWETDRWELRSVLKDQHTSSVIGCAISPDGRWLISASHDRTLRVWDIQSERCMSTFYGSGAFFACAFADSKRIVATGELGVYFLHLQGI